MWTVSSRYFFALGDHEMMEFMNDNPAVEGYPLSYTNDPEVTTSGRAGGLIL
jgi:acyl-CoA hydrolase